MVGLDGDKQKIRQRIRLDLVLSQLTHRILDADVSRRAEEHVRQGRVVIE